MGNKEKIFLKTINEIKCYIIIIVCNIVKFSKVGVKIIFNKIKFNSFLFKISKMDSQPKSEETLGKAVFIGMAAIFVIVGIVTIVFALIILVYYWKVGYKKHTFNLLFIGHCICSIVITVIGVFEITTIASKTYFYGNAMCKSTAYLVESINAYFLISYTFICTHNFVCYKFTRFYKDFKRSIYILSFIFLFTLLLCIPIIFAFKTEEVGDQIVITFIDFFKIVFLFD